MNWLLYIHIIAATAWIGGSIFMFALGVFLKDKEKQSIIYPEIAPIFGYFELVSLVILLSSGTWIMYDAGMLSSLLRGDSNEILNILKTKLWMVLIIVIATILHFIVALKTNNAQRSQLENLISRSSSLLVFFLNFVVVYFAMLIRTSMG